MRSRSFATVALFALTGCHQGHGSVGGPMQQHGPLTFIATPSSVVADGKAAATLTVILSPEDVAAGIASGQEVTLTSTVNGDTFTPARGLTSGRGVFTARLSSTVAGARLLTAQMGSLQATRPVMFLAPPAACEGTLLLPSVPATKIGYAPLGLVRADFNGDGKMDLAATNSGDTFKDQVSVLLGKGDGTFQPAADYPVGVVPVGIAVDDFDGDGHLDIAAATASGPRSNHALSVLLGKGDGTFADVVNSVPDTGGFEGLSAGDLNGDGKPDLVATGDTILYPGMAVLLGKGDGTFETPDAYLGDKIPDVTVIADFDGDGKKDVAEGDNDSNIYVLRGNGDGTLDSRDMMSFPAGEAPQSIAVGDFNGDGKGDLTTGNFDGTLSVLLGEDHGTFGSALSLHAASIYTFDIPIDLNGDGKLDLVAADLAGVKVLLGKGDGTFQSSVGFGTGTEPYALVDADFNADGHLDVAAMNYHTGNVTMLLGKGDGSLEAPTVYNVGANAVGVTTGDLDGDGYLDVVTANGGGSDLSVMLGKGDGTFQKAVPHRVGNQPKGVVIGDFDGDGHPDLASVNFASENVSVLLGKGDGTFGSSAAYPVGHLPLSLTTGDFNGDGVIDLATADFNDGASGTASVLLGSGDGTFQSAGAYAAAAGSVGICAVDVDGDGHLDLAVTNDNDDAVTVLRGYGDGSFRAATGDTSYSTGLAPIAVAAADLNGDGRPDLVTADLNSDGVTVLLNHGDGTFADGVNHVTGNGASAVTIADVDGDGKLDLLVTNGGNPLSRVEYTGSSTVSLLRGIGDGSFQRAMNYPVGGAPAGVTTGDFNGDGRNDVLSANSGDSTLSVLLSTGCIP